MYACRVIGGFVFAMFAGVAVAQLPGTQIPQPTPPPQPAQMPQPGQVFSYSAFIVGYSETDPLPVSGRR
jgi:hypothetical protein